MKDYLQREEKLFAERMASARSAVQQLDSAILRFRKDTGEFPGSLAELLSRPERMAGKTGSWPYLPGERIPLDPWGQYYRYQSPGRHNIGGFDVWSVHGNERDPKGWIGNWK
jgi:hypothetical protein